MAEKIVSILNCGKDIAFRVQDPLRKNEWSFSCPEGVMVQVRQRGSDCGNCVTGQRVKCSYWKDYVNNPLPNEGISGKTVYPQFNRQISGVGDLPSPNYADTSFKVIVNPATCRSVPVPEIEIDQKMLNIAIEMSEPGDNKVWVNCPKMHSGKNRPVMAETNMQRIHTGERYLKVDCAQFDCDYFRKKK